MVHFAMIHGRMTHFAMIHRAALLSIGRYWAAVFVVADVLKSLLLGGCGWVSGLFRCRAGGVGLVIHNVVRKGKREQTDRLSAETVLP